MSSIIRSMKRSIIRDEYQKKHGHSMNYHARQQQKEQIYKMYHDAIKQKAGKNNTFFDRIKKLLKKRQKI